MPNVRAAPLDPALFAPASAAVPAPAGASATAVASQAQPSPSHVLSKGDDIWYRHRSGVWMEGRVTHVDLSLDPPSYQVETRADGMVRDTERPRLKPRLPGEIPPPADTSVLQSAAAPPPQATPSTASSTPTAAVPGVTVRSPGGNTPWQAPPASATHTTQTPGPQALPSAPPAQPQKAGHLHGNWYGQYAQAHQSPFGHHSQPCGSNNLPPGQPSDARLQHGYPRMAMPHQAHPPHGGQPQGYMPQGYVPQYLQQGPVRADFPQYPSAQWPQTQSVTPGNQMGGHNLAGGGYHTPYHAQSYAAHSGSQPLPNGTQGWTAQPGGNPGPAPGDGDRSNRWTPLQYNANMMYPQQPSGHSLAGVGPQWQQHGHAGPHGGAAPSGHQAGPGNSTLYTGAKPIDDLFSGMQIRQ